MFDTNKIQRALEILNSDFPTESKTDEYNKRLKFLKPFIDFSNHVANNEFISYGEMYSPKLLITHFPVQFFDIKYLTDKTVDFFGIWIRTESIFAFIVVTIGDYSYGCIYDCTNRHLLQILATNNQYKRLLWGVICPEFSNFFVPPVIDLGFRGSPADCINKLGQIVENLPDKLVDGHFNLTKANLEYLLVDVCLAKANLLE